MNKSSIAGITVSLLLPVLIFSGWARSQNIPGHLMVAGGGAEVEGGWSDPPYRWVTEKSLNRKVACITTDDAPTNWLPQYFMSLGASWSRNFIIHNSQAANDQETYDSLITYDALFFKGGDQWEYYHIYNGTPVEQAAMEIFNRGGVISGTSAGLQILGEVDFTAMNGTVYSEEALEDPFNTYMTLSDDFLPLLPDAVFDSHVAERGRFGRIIGFLGHWSLSGKNNLLGIGVDDKTALCIDTTLTGLVYGTGAVGIYRPGYGNVFSLSGSKLLANNLIVSQALHSCSIDFNTLIINGFQEETEPSFYGESLSGLLIMSASDAIAENEEFLNRLAQLTLNTEEIIIITGYSLNSAQAVQTQLNQLGASSGIFSTIPDNYDDPLWFQRLQNSKVYLFTDNNLQVLKDFLEYGSNGQYIKASMKDSQKTFAFMGSDSRYAGKYCVANYQQEYASYDGLLETEDGLALLQNSLIMPNTFSQDSDVENTATGLPYVLTKYNLAYGFWMHGDTWMEIAPVNEHVLFNAGGSCPVIFLENPGSPAGFASMPASSSGLPRNISGFQNFRMQLFDQSSSLLLLNVAGTHELPNRMELNVFPNPATELICITGTVSTALYKVKIFNLAGESILEKETLLPGCIPLKKLINGVYILEIRNQRSTVSGSKKIIIQK